MALTIEEVKKNAAYKQLPILTLDERYHVLFPEKDKTDEIRECEKKLNDLLKRQGQINNDLKEVHKIKDKLMQSIIDNVENMELSESKRQKLMATNQKLIIEAKLKREELEQEQLDIPYKIHNANIKLVIECVQVCYDRIHSNYRDIQKLAAWIDVTRTELKRRIIIKQDKEIANTNIYTYMHDLLGPEMMEVFDNKEENG